MTLNNLPIAIKECFQTNLFRAALTVVAVGILPQASFAHSVSCGDGTTANVAINNGAAWVLLEDCLLYLDDGYHDCVVTASADIDNPGGAYSQNRYRLAVAVNGAPAVTDDVFERMATVPNNGGAPYTEDVTTVGWFYGLPPNPNPYTFASYGRKRTNATITANAIDSSLSVVCVDQDTNRPPDQDPDNDLQ